MNTLESKTHLATKRLLTRKLLVLYVTHRRLRISQKRAGLATLQRLVRPFFMGIFFLSRSLI